MSDKIYKILLSGNPERDARHVYDYLYEVAETLSIKQDVSINYQNILCVTHTIHDDFYRLRENENASPFKRVADFAIVMCQEKPVISKLPVGRFKRMDQIISIPNHQNAFFAYQLAVDGLHGAELHKKGDTTPTLLKERIIVSMHTYIDMIKALSIPFRRNDFSLSINDPSSLISLLFEQLAYRANPDASYPLEV